MLKTILPALFLCLATSSQAQYLEPFSTPNKGYLLNFMDDFTGVNWTLSPWAAPTNRDDADYFQTTNAGVLEAIDLDQEVCWESPLLNTAMAPTVSLSVDLSWVGFDTDIAGDPCTEASLDYIKVQYSVDGGLYITAPNVAGGSTCATVGYAAGTPGSPFSGNATVIVNNIPGGSTLRIRMCVNINANAEVVTIDNVSVPEQGVTLGCSAPVLSLNATPITCGGPNSGAIDLSVLGGTPGYNYAWSSGSFQEDLVNIPEGTYTVTVTDAAGCTATGSAAVGTAPFSITADINPATCEGVFDGSVDLIIKGGIPPYTVDWGDLPGSNNPEDRFGLETGLYIVTVSDAGVCTAETNVLIELAPANPYLETFNVDGKGLLPGSTCTGINATSCTNVNFAGVNWSIYGLDTLFGIDPDDHFHTTSGRLLARDLDQEVCWESPLIDIDPPGAGLAFSLDLTWEEFDAEPPGPDPMDLVADHIDVEYSLDGGPWVRVDNQVGGGITGHTVVYANGAGNGNTGSAKITVNDLSGGNLRIRVCGFLNSNLETFSLDNVSVPSSTGLYCPLPDAGVVVTDASCYGSSDGAINLSLSGGTPPFTIQWSNGATTEDISDLPAGQYVVTVSNNWGFKTLNVQVGEPAEIIITQDLLLSKPVSCFGGSDGALGVQVQNGQQPYGYAWSNGQTGNPIENLSSGSYSVTVTDGMGCTSALNNIVLPEPSPVMGQLGFYDDVLCPGQTTTLTAVITGGTPPYQFLINGMPGPLNVGPGTYQIQYIDMQGCADSASIVIEEAAPSGAAIIGADTVCLNALTAFSLPGPYSNYQWQASNNAVIESGQGTNTVMVRWPETGSTMLSVNFLNADGCQDGASLNLFVDICVGTSSPTLPGIQVAPNPFAEYLQVFFERPVAPGARLRLYDAQGRLVFEQSALSSSIRIPSTELPAGLYLLYIVEDGRHGVWKVVKQ